MILGDIKREELPMKMLISLFQLMKTIRIYISTFKILAA